MSLGFVFPGQGSQSVGMLAELATHHEEVQRTFAEASDVLGIDLWTLVQEGPEEKLNQTVNTQPAMLTAGAAVWRVWRKHDGPVPVWMAGHSLGEYTALACAQALSFTDAVGLVADRGRFMQEAVPIGQGSMAAIMGLDDVGVSTLCERCADGEVLSPVNFNAPGQVVVAGTTAAVERAVAQAKAAGARRALMLPVSGPFHCELMRPAADRMAQRLQSVEIRSPSVPVLHNVHAAAESEPEAIRRALVEQIRSPVRWVDTVTKMAAAGVGRVIECGPGKVLLGLNRRITREVDALPVFDTETLEHALSVVREG
ncbi:MAG: ACP S-malonyltransferase [Acidiferrobacterales bacterium]